MISAEIVASGVAFKLILSAFTDLKMMTFAKSKRCP